MYTFIVHTTKQTFHRIQFREEMKKAKKKSFVQFGQSMSSHFIKQTPKSTYMWILLNSIQLCSLITNFIFMYCLKIVTFVWHWRTFIRTFFICLAIMYWKGVLCLLNFGYVIVVPITSHVPLSKAFSHRHFPTIHINYIHRHGKFPWQNCYANFWQNLSQLMNALWGKVNLLLVSLWRSNFNKYYRK